MGKDRQTSNQDDLKAIAQAAAKNIKEEYGLSDFRRMLAKIAVEAAPNAALEDLLGYSKNGSSEIIHSRNGSTSKTSQIDGVKFWLNVLTKLQNRRLKDILTASADGLKGCPDAINTVFLKLKFSAVLYTCYVTP